MLKWAVNEQIRQSYLETLDVTDNQCSTVIDDKVLPEPSKTPVIRTNRKKFINVRKNLRRKSITTTYNEMANLKRKLNLKRDKENNNLTSTPIPLSKGLLGSTSVTSPLRKLHSLKDLSNVSLPLDNCATAALSPILQTPKNQKNYYNQRNCFTVAPKYSDKNPSQYATTLPTFDVEYSPSCNSTTVPGQILALRGIGIADSYFDKPRYLSDKTALATIEPIIEKHNKTNSSKKSSNLNDNNNSILHKFIKPQMTTTEHNKFMTNNLSVLNDESTLSSSRMGDTTLNKMIDAILESARKEKRTTISKFRQSQSNHHNHHHQSHHRRRSMSSTYTPADDPASDLNELWCDTKIEKHPQNDFKDRKHKRRSSTVDLDKKCDISKNQNIYNEREVKTPENSHYNLDVNEENEHNDLEEKETSLCLLKRQKAVRRKRKLSLNSNVSDIKAKRLHSDENENRTITNLLRNKSIDELAAMDTPKGYYHNSNNRNSNNSKTHNENNGKHTISPDSGRNSPSDFEFESPPSENLNLFVKKRLSFSSVSTTITTNHPKEKEKPDKAIVEKKITNS